METIEIREALHKYIDNSTDDIISAVFAFFQSYNNTSSVQDLAAYNADIHNAMNEIDNGEFLTHEEVKGNLKKS